jgi:hypothetical protein
MFPSISKLLARLSSKDARNAAESINLKWSNENEMYFFIILRYQTCTTATC